MTTQPTLVAKQARLKEWAEQIRDCRNRPQGMDIETWCVQNHLTKANYYYRLRRVREAYLEQMPDSIPTFVELPSSDSKDTFAEKSGGNLSIECKPMIRIWNKAGLSAEVFSVTSPELFRSLIEVVATIVRFQFRLDSYDKNTRFLFCGRRSDRIKALLWEGDGFLLYL